MSTPCVHVLTAHPFKRIEETYEEEEELEEELEEV